MHIYISVVILGKKIAYFNFKNLIIKIFLLQAKITVNDVKPNHQTRKYHSFLTGHESLWIIEFTEIKVKIYVLEQTHPDTKTRKSCYETNKKIPNCTITSLFLWNIKAWTVEWWVYVHFLIHSYIPLIVVKRNMVELKAA